MKEFAVEDDHYFDQSPFYSHESNALDHHHSTAYDDTDYANPLHGSFKTATAVYNEASASYLDAESSYHEPSCESHETLPLYTSYHDGTSYYDASAHHQNALPISYDKTHRGLFGGSGVYQVNFRKIH